MKLQQAINMSNRQNVCFTKVAASYFHEASHN